MEIRHTHTGLPLHLGAGLAANLRQTLQRFCAESEVRYAAILEESGTVCAEHGDPALRDRGETGALAVGAFAAIQAISKRLGDSTFEGLYHEGKGRQFHLSAITPRFLLLCVFETSVRYALVKLCAAKVRPKLAELLESPPERVPEMVRAAAAGDLVLGSSLFPEG